MSCKHKRLKYHGLQKIGNNQPPLALFNCVDCNSTISKKYISPLDVSKTIRKACKDSKKEQSRKSVTVYVQNGIITKCNRLNLG